jgi:hypothetical protein
MLAIAMHKQQREDAIEDALEELSYAFPRLNTLRELKPKASLRALLVEVFALVILFCRDTIDYFSKRIGRLVAALSPKELKMKTLGELRKKLSEIRNECEIIMLQELAAIRLQLEDVQRTSTDTNKRVHMVQRRADRESRAELRRLLGLKMQSNGYFPNTDVEEYKSVLALDFAERREKPRRGRRARGPRQATWDMLKEQNAFSEWVENHFSSLLVLSGTNWREDTQTPLCWLSHASVLAVEAFQKQAVDRGPESPLCLLWFFFQANYTRPDRQKASFADVIQHLICQLAEQQPDLLQSRWEHITDTIASSRWSDPNRERAFMSMAQLLRDLMAKLPEGTEVRLIVDRLDQCRWTDDPSDKTDELHNAVWALLSLAQDRSLAKKNVRTKILLVVDEGSGRMISGVMGSQRGRSLEMVTDWAEETDDEDEED